MRNVVARSESRWVVGFASQSGWVSFTPIQPGDVPATYADVDDLVRDIGFRPTTPIDLGVSRFVQWYREFYGL